MNHKRHLVERFVEAQLTNRDLNTETPENMVQTATECADEIDKRFPSEDETDPLP